MATPIEPIMSGTVVTKEGQDTLVRGSSHDIHFHFAMPTMPEDRDELMRTVFAGIPEGPSSATCTYGTDDADLLYRVDRFERADLVVISYSLRKKA